MLEDHEPAGPVMASDCCVTAEGALPNSYANDIAAGAIAVTPEVEPLDPTTKFTCSVPVRDPTVTCRVPLYVFAPKPVGLA